MLFAGLGITFKRVPTPQITLDRKTYPYARVVGYARVSTVDQDPQMQIDALHEAGVHDDQLFSEQVSGAAKKRPQLDLAIKQLQAGDVFVIWKLDRLARSVEDLWRRIREIEAMGARFVCLTQSLDTSTAVGKLMISVIGAMAEFERDLTVERTRRGMEAKAQRGFHVGRPPLFTPERVAKLRKLLKSGKSIPQAARQMKLSETGVRSRFKVERKRGKIIITEKKD